MAGADLVIEAAAERLEVKRSLLMAAARATPEEVLIASSSSTLLPSLLQAGVRHPERVLVLHPLHPVERIPVVEVVPGAQTGPGAVARARELLLALGKVPVLLRREVPGYLINRMVAALWREAVDLVLQGVASPEEVDLALSRGPCLGWSVQGPFLTYQLAAPGGLAQFMEHLHPAFEPVWQSLADWDRIGPRERERLAELVSRAYPLERRGVWEAERDRHLGP